MKKRNTIHSSTLGVGEIFYSTCYGDIAHCVIAQGPEILAYVEVGQPLDTSWFLIHEYVWIDELRTKVGDFGVGDKIKIPDRFSYVLTITAVGKDNSLMTREDGYEYSFSRDRPATGVKG